ncbi:MAG: NERD domain-containing protein [Anaerolineae bacterium]
MAQWIKIGEAENTGEILVCQHLAQTLPDSYLILSNVTIPDANGNLELDAVVLGLAGVYVIEVKDWAGRIEGRFVDRDWKQNGRTVHNPCRQVSRAAKVLHNYVGRNSERVYGGDKRKFLGLNAYAMLVFVSPKAEVHFESPEDNFWFRLCPRLDDLSNLITERIPGSRYFIAPDEIPNIARALGAPAEEVRVWKNRQDAVMGSSAHETPPVKAASPGKDAPGGANGPQRLGSKQDQVPGRPFVIEQQVDSNEQGRNRQPQESAKLPATPICSNCGWERNKPAARFCAQCGAKL